MQRLTRLRMCIAVFLALGLALAPLGASASGHATPAPPEADAGDGDAAAWVGRFCTPLGCRGASGSAVGDAAGFALATAALTLLARRRRA